MVDERRVRILNGGEYKNGPIVYIMGRDFRVDDNWALLYAQELALKHCVPLCVLVHFGKNIVETNERQHSFLVGGLEEVSQQLEQLHIPFFITYGNWENEFSTFVNHHAIGAIVTDFSPLHELRWWWDKVAAAFTVPIYEVDAHNIIPCWVASPKEEFAAYTFRPKVKKLYQEFRGPIPEVKTHPYKWGSSKVACWPRGVDKNGCEIIDWAGVKAMRSFDIKVRPITWCKPGEKAAKKMLSTFLAEKLPNYGAMKNDPNAEVVSNLSPYIRHGFISTQYIADQVEKARCDNETKRVFLDELVVRRELAENFCFYNQNYDNFEGAHVWAKATLNEHRHDAREYVYTLEEFEAAKTHDYLWNAAQLEMVSTGKMNGYMRMYWAKKILEWSPTPEEAIQTAVLLNDRYSIDGRDPNGYAGVMWSIAGVHDRAWGARPVFGMVRYMNYNGAKRKFDVELYIRKYIGQPALL